MKTVLQLNPIFTPATISSPGILNFTPVVNASIPWSNNRLMAVINQTQNIIIYAEGQSGFGGTWGYGGNPYQLQLQYSTIGHNANDTIQVIWDDPRIGTESVLTAPLSSDTPKGWPLAKTYLTTVSTNLNVLKSSPGTLAYLYLSPGRYEITNCVLKLYDKATVPNLDVDVPKLIIPVAQSTAWNGVGNFFSPTLGIKFYNGISYAVTGGLTNTDKTNSQANVVINFVYA